VFSIWRVATIVEHRATTYPTFDPTWYAPVTLIQACLEVDAASICASIPIFWPVLVAKYDQIFVTKEVTVTREHRWPRNNSEAAGLELHHSRSSSTGNLGSTHSDGTSERYLNMSNTYGVATDYNDPYVLSQVDPLRTDESMGMESKVTVGPWIPDKVKIVSS
jgi:hypothetical protein